MPANLNRKQQREIKAVVERAKKDNGVPQTAQQSIPFQRMFPDGICRVTDSFYTKTIQFQDINYQLAQQEDKTAIFDEWCGFLNFFDSSIHFELSFMNMSTDAESFEKSIRIPFRKDAFNSVRAEYSQMLKKQLSQGNNGLTKTKFLTFGIEADSMRQAKPRLQHIENDLLNNFRRLGVIAHPMNGKERLRLMHSMAMEDDYGMLDGIINNGKAPATDERPSVLGQLKEMSVFDTPHSVCIFLLFRNLKSSNISVVFPHIEYIHHPV